MNMYTNTKKSKKFILILVLLLLFSFCYPKNVNAALEFEDLTAVPARLFYWAERGILKYLNNIFCDDGHDTKTQTEVDENNYVVETLNISLTPENIIKGKFIIFDANIFRELDESEKDEYFDFDIGAVKDGKIKLREIVSGWYYALRNFAIVALLSVLVYVGIRMIMSTVAQDKAKYKTMFKDWLVALCLVVVMHYMMIGILNITTLVTKSIGTSGQNANIVGNMMSLVSAITREQDGTGRDKHYGYTDTETNTEYDIGDAYAFILVIAGIIIYTFIFTVKYLKREFTIIFLILLGPVSCVTYPIDKISDGKAQAFNKWFSEFLYQVIIQPFHLLLYIVLVGSAAELAESNVIYALICFAVMIPAEKFIKEMFGFKDKLGSPLGAFAGGALASKAISALTSKGKGSGGSGGGNDDNNSTQNQLPPKTVDKKELSGGNGDNSGSSNGEQGSTIAQQDNQALESGEEPGGGASAAAAYQDSDDPVLDAERAALEEQIADGQINEDELTDEQRKLLGREDGDEPDSAENTSNNQDNTTNNEENSSSQQSNWDKIKSIHNQRVSKKYGSTQRKQRWKRRIGRGLKAGAKGVLKGGLIGMVGTAAMAGAFMTGNGKEALGIAAGIGAYAGKKALDGGKTVIKGATGAVKDYRNGLRSDDSKEKKALKDFKADKNQIDKAVLSYRENHEGQDPGYEDLDQEMNDRFSLSRYGLDDDQIDRAVGSFQELRDEQGVPENEALNQTVYASKLAKDYSKKDFRSEKTMKEAIDTISQNFQKYGAPKDIADANAKKYLAQAAKIKGTEIALPSTNQTIDMEVPNVSSALGVQQANLSEAQLERMNNMTLRLHQAGYSSSEIERIAKGCANSRMDSVHVVESYNTKVEFLTDGQAQKDAREWVAVSNKVGTQNVTDKQVKVEMENRLELLSVGAKPEDMNGILVADEALYQSHTKDDRQMALDIAGKLSSRQMNESREMDKVIKDTAKKLVKDGRASGNGIKKATEIVERAANFKGTTAVYTIKE